MSSYLIAKYVRPNILGGEKITINISTKSQFVIRYFYDTYPNSSGIVSRNSIILSVGKAA